jgi:myo-inositol 2-dehydrogenase/D-chiro-inositol 1-dehydrogenase
VIPLCLNMEVDVVLRAGIIGTGNMGADHARTLAGSVARVDVVAVTDVATERAEEVARELPGDVRVMSDAYALIQDADVDGVIITSHDSTHRDYVLGCVAAGKPVMCEKPLAPTVAECEEVVAAEQAAGGGLISLGFMRRFDPAHADLRAAVAAGTHGAPLLLHCVSRGVSSAPGATDELSVTGSAIHEFDTVPWLLGSPITEVSWHAPRTTGEVTGLRDPQLILLRTADGALTTVEVFLNARYGYDIRCEIVAERGTLATAGPARLVTDSDRARSTAYPADWRPRFADAYRLELQAWTDAVAAGRRPTPLATAHDGLVAGAVAEAVIASMRNGGRTVAVQVPEVS